MMHGHEKSDSAIVAVKPANKTEQPAAERSAVESTVAVLLHRQKVRIKYKKPQGVRLMLVSG